MSHKVIPDTLDWFPAKAKGFYSKKLLKSNSGTVRLIKIEPGASYPEHLHVDKTEYAYILTGNPEFIIDDADFESQPGDFFILTQGVKHGIKNKSDTDCLVLFGDLKP